MLGVPVACAIAVVPTRPKSRRYDFDASYVGLDGESSEAADDEDDEEEEVTMILDPSLEEEKLAKSKFVFSWAFGSGLGKPNGTGPNSEAECVYTESEGSFDDVQVSLSDPKRTMQKVAVLIYSRSSVPKGIQRLEILLRANFVRGPTKG